MLHKSKIKIGSNRNFGLVFFFVFLIVGFWPLLNGEVPRIWSLIIAVIFLILGLMNSKILTPLKILWFKFGLFLGGIVSPIVMGIVFFFVITPIGLFMKLIGKDLLNNKLDNNKKSYWIIRDKVKSSMKQQF
tara:strand:- start:393 stop:788 length:396 start_codon:yes stop_codon:yes gene_type:complete